MTARSRSTCKHDPNLRLHHCDLGTPKLPYDEGRVADSDLSQRHNIQEIGACCYQLYDGIDEHCLLGLWVCQ